MPAVTLYFRPTCPFCQKVLHFMDQKSIKIEQKDVSTSNEYRQELINKGGKTQIPALEVDGNIMYESEDIIQWLRNNHPPS